MNIFKLIMLFNSLTSEVSKAMDDKKLTILEMLDIIESVVQNITGKGFNDIGFRIYKQGDKTKIEFEF